MLLKIDAFELWCWRRLLRVPWTARRSNQSILKEITPEYWKNWCWSWSSNTLATSCEELTHWKRPWCWQRLRAGGEGDDRGWDGWMASPTQWTWIWASSGSWWWTGKPGVLQFMGSQWIGHNWATELNSWPFTRVLQVDPPLSIWRLTTIILKDWNEHCPLRQDRWVPCISVLSMGKCSWNFMTGMCWQS